ncbi:MAG TPA: hypothetical protein VGO46_05785 [Gemmatimonadaceae bacterium]|nr:hypothetical protein [Gemmatimonadaceae bacterium]
MVLKHVRGRQRALLVAFFTATAARAHPAAAQTLADRLAIHGYLTQGYAVADSHQLVGIPHSGTFDYRRAALLFRFKGTPKDAFVVQLANRELGDSPIDDFTSEVQLDWAFYERRLGSKTTLRIGKAPIPMGIFNETRYVGTLLPFYRAPLGFYQEGTFTSETLNGLVLTRLITPGSRWKLSGSLFGGGFDYLQAGTIVTPGDTNPSYTVTRAKVKNLLGAQLWLQTPLTGLRVGLGGERRDDYGAFDGATSDTHGTHDWWASVDGNFERLSARAEYRQFAFNSGTIHATTYYGQIGYRVLEALTVNVQRDVMDVRYVIPGGELELPYSRDNALGIDYAFASNIVGKFEIHAARGLGAEEPLDVLAGRAVQENYLIASLSVSF